MNKPPEARAHKKKDATTRETTNEKQKKINSIKSLKINKRGVGSLIPPPSPISHSLSVALVRRLHEESMAAG